MARTGAGASLPKPGLVPIGAQALLVRFATALSDDANCAAIGFAHRLQAQLPAGVVEIHPNLVSVLIRYDPRQVTMERLAGEVRLLLGPPWEARRDPSKRHVISANFGGAVGPDLVEVATSLGLSPEAFVAAHNYRPLRVLATGFAPGFVYCGFHGDELVVPRRQAVRAMVPAGTILFAAGQTAITATAIPTGWHVLGRTRFRNFDASRQPPTQLREGDEISFEAAP